MKLSILYVLCFYIIDIQCNVGVFIVFAVCTVDGVFTDFDLSQASVHDIHYLKDIKQIYKNCTILGDKGYLNIDYQRDLFSSNQIKLEVPMRRNQHNYIPQATTVH